MIPCTVRKFGYGDADAAPLLTCFSFLRCRYLNVWNRYRLLIFFFRRHFCSKWNRLPIQVPIRKTYTYTYYRTDRIAGIRRIVGIYHRSFLFSTKKTLIGRVAGYENDKFGRISKTFKFRETWKKWCSIKYYVIVRIRELIVVVHHARCERPVKCVVYLAMFFNALILIPLLKITICASNRLTKHFPAYPQNVTVG